MSKHTTLKQRLFHAIIAGKIGNIKDRGIVVTQKEFIAHFEKQVTTKYISSFLPAATIEKGQTSASHTRYMIRLRKGVYLVHPDALDAAVEVIIDEYKNKHTSGIEDECQCYVVEISLSTDKSSIKD